MVLEKGYQCLLSLLKNKKPQLTKCDAFVSVNFSKTKLFIIITAVKLVRHYLSNGKQWIKLYDKLFVYCNRGIANHTDNNTPYDACSDFDGPVVSQEEVSINDLMII